MNEKDIEIYHVETQEDYDDLMIKLEGQGYKWVSGHKPTSKHHYWYEYKEDTIVYLNDGGDYLISRGSLKNHKIIPRAKDVTKYEAKEVKQVGKVIVPKFVANWFERNKKGHTIYGLLYLFSDNYYLFDGFRKWVEDYNLKEADAQEIIAKMYLFQNYEVEEEKRYYWRKKKEHMFKHENQEYSYVNVYKKTNKFSHFGKNENIYFKTWLSEDEVRKVFDEVDFNKLEPVEIKK